VNLGVVRWRCEKNSAWAMPMVNRHFRLDRFSPDYFRHNFRARIEPILDQSALMRTKQEISQDLLENIRSLGSELEARVGIEPTHKGFADLSLTTWVPRLGRAVFFQFAPHRRSLPGWRRRAIWSGRRDLNSRPSPWQGDALPLSYSRLMQIRVYRAV
jgi:hypothetical protein